MTMEKEKQNKTVRNLKSSNIKAKYKNQNYLKLKITRHDSMFILFRHNRVNRNKYVNIL